jgi:hypothetical protein
MAQIEKSPITTFIDLIQRVQSSTEPDACNPKPVLGWVVGVDRHQRPLGKRQRAILHDFTDLGLELAHPQLLTGKLVKITIPVPGGVEIHAILIRKASRRNGNLRETVAEFILEPALGAS